MKKQSKKSSKRNPVTSKTLREINKRIEEAFINIDNIEKHDHQEYAIGKELDWLAEALENVWGNLNPVHIATLLNKLGNLEINDQSIAINVIALASKKCAELLAHSRTAKYFKHQEIAQIFNSLPKLPIPWKKHDTMLSHVLARAATLAILSIFAASDIAYILSGMSHLGINPLKQAILIKKLLKTFEHPDNTFSKLDPETHSIVLNELWQFCVFTKSKVPSKTINTLLNFVDNALKAKKPETITPSRFQTTIYSLLLKLLAGKFVKEAVEEHPVGAYSLDIAFPEQKLNIEIDGPHHYRDRKLKRIHQFRDSIMKSLGWKVIRIPYFEWEELTQDTQAKVDYLLKKLVDHPDLLNPQSRERLKTFAPSLETTQEDAHLRKQQINAPPTNPTSKTMNTYGIFTHYDSTK